MRPLTAIALLSAVAAALCVTAAWYESARTLAAAALVLGGFRLALGFLLDATTDIPDINNPENRRTQ